MNLNLLSLWLWSACSLKGEIKWVINYETIAQCSTNTYGSAAAWVCWGHGQTALGAKAECTPLSAGKSLPLLEVESPSRKECIRPRDRLDLDLKLVFETPDRLYHLGTQNPSMPSAVMCTHGLTSGGSEHDFGTKALKVTSWPSKHRILVLDGPLEFSVHSIPGTDGETEAHAKRSYIPNVLEQKCFPSSKFILLLYRSAIYYKILTIWQRPIYNAVIGGIRLAHFYSLSRLIYQTLPVNSCYIWRNIF